MKNLFRIFSAVFFALFCTFFHTSSIAGAPATEAQVKLEFIGQLEKDGYLSGKLADEARVKYVDPRQLTAPGASPAVSAQTPKDSLWDRYFSLIGFAKVVAVVLFLVAFWGTVTNLIKGVWHLLVQIPAYAYQVPFLAASVYATLVPQAIWASQAIYVALLAAFVNLIIVGWVLAMYPKLAKALAQLFRLGIPVASVVSFWLMLYFGALALHYESAIFGFATAVCFSSMLSFGLYYSRGTLSLEFNEKALFAVVFGHLAVVIAYVLTKASGHYPASFEVFAGGVEYYSTIAMCVGLLCGSFPSYKKDNTTASMSMLFILVLMMAAAAKFILGQDVIGNLVVCFFILFMLEWIAYVGYKTGVIVGSAVTGAALYGVAMFFERHSSFLVLTMS